MSTLAISAPQPVQQTTWEHQLLNSDKNSILLEFQRRFKKAEKEFLRGRFDFNDVIVYAHQYYDISSCQGISSKQTLDSNKTLSRWIGKYGGRMKISMDETVNIVVIEEETMTNIISRFLKLREQVFSGIQVPELKAIKHSDTEAANQQSLRNVLRPKREMNLLAQPSTNIKSNQSNVNLKQLVLPFGDMSLQNESARTLRSKGRQQSQTRMMQDQVNQLLTIIRKQQDAIQKDFLLLYYLLKTPKVVIMDIDIMYEAMQKYQFFTKDFFIRKKIDIGSNMLMNQQMIPYMICFATQKKYNSNVKTNLQQFFHQFEAKNFQRQGSTIMTTPTVLVPYYRPDAPKGTSVFLDNDEYANIIKRRAKLEKDYEAHVQKLDLKTPESYDIKTPVPNGRHDYCSICQKRFEQYKPHLNSDEHKLCVSMDPFYFDIDLLIENMNSENERKKNKQQDEDSFTEIEEEEDYEEENQLYLTHRGPQSQELTNQFNMMSTEITTNLNGKLLQQINHKLKIDKKNMFTVPRHINQNQLNKQETVQQISILEKNMGQKRNRQQREEEDKIIKDFDYGKQLEQIEADKVIQKRPANRNRLGKSRFADQIDTLPNHYDVINKVMKHQ